MAGIGISARLASPPVSQSFVETVHGLISTPLTISLASLDQSPFAEGIPLSFEHAKTDFVARLVTVEFTRRIDIRSGH